MPILDEQQFESYLKGFRPIAPESLQVEFHPRARRRRFAWTAWATACAACLVLAVLLFPHRGNPTRPSPGNGNLSSVSPYASSRPLTLGRANALLAEVPSFKEAVDQLSFQPQPSPESQGKQSALAALGKEDFKL